MKTKHLILILFAIGMLAALTTESHAQTASKPAKPVKMSAEKLFDRIVKAMGGRSALKKHTSLVLKAKVELTNYNFSGTSESYGKAPNKSYTVMKLEPFGSFEQWFDGERGWQSDPINGLQEVTGVELAYLRRESTFQSELQWKTFWRAVEVVGLEELDGRQVYKVVFTPPAGGGNPVTQYYDAQSFLLVRSETILETSEATVPTVSTYSDYREVSGVMLPFVTEQRVSLGTIRIVVTEATFDVPIDDAKFTRR